MTQSHDTFLDIVRSSQTVAERWASICEKVIAEASERGVQLEPEQVLQIREARLAALGNNRGEMDPDNYLAELEALPELHDAQLARRISEGDAEARAIAIAEVNRGKDNVHPDRQGADAARRIAKARELGVATPPPEQSTVSTADRLETLKEIRDPAERIHLARKWGLIQNG